MKLYTCGYSGRRASGVADVLDALDGAPVILLDVRYSPRSRVPEWSGGALARLHGARYLHVRELGNVNFRGDGPIRLADPSAGVARVRALGEAATVVVLCACRDRASCHRDVVARLLVRELGAEDAGELPTLPPRQLALW